MEYRNPQYDLPERNLFNFRKEQYSKILNQITRLTAIAEDFNFKLSAFDVKKPKISKGALSYTFSETLNLIFSRGEEDDPNKNIIDLSMKIPCMYDDFHIYINGKKKIPRYQMFDMPLLRNPKAGNNILSVQTNVKRVTITVAKNNKKKSKPPFVMLECEGKKIPFALILFAIYGCQKVVDMLLLRKGYKKGEYFKEGVGEIIPENELTIHKRPLKTRWDALLFDIYELYDGRTTEEYITQVGQYFNKFNPKEKGEDFLLSLQYLLKFDIITQDLLKTDDMLNLLLNIIYIENPSFDNLNYAHKRIRCIEYMILRHFIVNIHNMCITCRNTKKPKFNVSVSKILSDCNVSDIIIYDFAINPVDQMVKICQATLGGPNGFNKDNVPTAMRDIHPSMIGRVCPVDTPDRENCGVVQNLVSTASMDNNYKFTNIVENKDNITSIPVSMTPFLEHDDQVRLQMASSQMRQSIALSSMERPLISSGCNGLYTKYTDFLNIAEDDGEVLYKDYSKMIIGYKNGEIRLLQIGLRAINTDNMDILTSPFEKGDLFSKHEVLTSSIFIKEKDAIWGVNLKTAIMPYYGYNHEDGIVISDRLVTENVLTSGHYVDLSFTIPSDKVLTNRWKPNEIRNCMEESYVYKPIPLVHETIEKNDIYACLKQIPSGQLNFTDMFKEPTKLISQYKTTITSVEMYANSWNKTIHEYRDWVEQTIELQKLKNQNIINIVKNSMDANDADRFISHHNLAIFEATGKYKEKEEKIEGILVKMTGYYERKIQIGDKMANRHGNKGIISLIQEKDKMPRDENGVPVDIIISHMGVPSRMNPGQLFELHLCEAVANMKIQMHEMLDDNRMTNENLKDYLLGFISIIDKTNDRWYTKQLVEQLPQIIDHNFINEWYVVQAPFYSVKLDDLRKALAYAKSKFTQIVFDPLLNDNVETEISIGHMYFGKLAHLAEPKMSARSVGITSPKTMQPLSGKKNNGGQKMGEMETLAVIAYDIPAVLNENRTVKSDSIEIKDKIIQEISYGKELEIGVAIDTKPETNFILEDYIAILTIDMGGLDL